MKVYFSGNYWGHEPYERAGKPLAIHKTFTWAGNLWKIPAVYECKKGLVIDLCKRIPNEAVEAFFEKWPQERREGQLDDEELEALENETPFAFDFRPNIYINGMGAGGASSCSMGWYFLDQEHQYCEDISEELMEAYDCDRSFAWLFTRICVTWPEAFRAPMTSISMHLEPTKRGFTCGQRFVTKPGMAPWDLVLEHPLTKAPYTLHVLGASQGRVDDHTFDGISARVRPMEFPKCYLTLDYALEGPEGQSPDAETYMIRDCENGDAPVESTMGAASSDDTVILSCSVIGGESDGPTSVFFAGKVTSDPESERKTPGSASGLPVRSAISALHFRPVAQVRWRVTFFAYENEPLDVEIL